MLSVPFPVDAVDKWGGGQGLYLRGVGSQRRGPGGLRQGDGDASGITGESISGDLDTSKPEYGGGDVQDWGDNEWESGFLKVGDEYAGGIVTGSIPRSDGFARGHMEPTEALTWSGQPRMSWVREVPTWNLRNGRELTLRAKEYSETGPNGETGDFAVDYPVFHACYASTRGEMPSPVAVTGQPQEVWICPALLRKTVPR